MLPTTGAPKRKAVKLPGREKSEVFFFGGCRKQGEGKKMGEVSNLEEKTRMLLVLRINGFFHPCNKSRLDTSRKE